MCHDTGQALLLIHILQNYRNLEILTDSQSPPTLMEEDSGICLKKGLLHIRTSPCVHTLIYS